MTAGSDGTRTESPNARWAFGEFAIDERRLELSRSGERIALEGKPLQLLLLLVRHAGEVVTKDELLEQIWPGRIPSESVLTKAMTKLRQALNDEEQALIRTVYGFGYKLVAPVALAVDTPATPVVTRFAVGDTPPLRPNWRMVRQLVGGRSDVWVSRNDKTGEQRVIKFATDADALRALKREITLFRVLKDSQIDPNGYVRVIDWSLDELPYFLESEFAAGGSLPDWIESRGGFDAVPLAERLGYFLQAAQAIAAAHDAGVLHKDLKPANLVMGQDENGAMRVKLSDFGSGHVLDAARLQRLAITRAGLTQTMLVNDSTSGTPLYLAPELLAGHAPSVRSDVFALGVILYQLVVGDFRRPLAPGWERDIADELLREDIAAAVDGDPMRRFGDAGGFAARIDTLEARRVTLAADRAADAERSALQATLGRSELKRRYLGLTVAVLLVGLVTTAILASRLWMAERSRDAALATARSEARASNQVTGYLVSLFDAASPERSDGQPIEPRLLVDRGQALLSDGFMDQPVLRARLLATVGSLYCKLGLPAPCASDLREAIALDAKSPQPDPATSLQFRFWQAQAQMDSDANSDAEQTLRSALRMAEVSGAQAAGMRPLLLLSLGEALHAQFKSAESVQHFERARRELVASGQIETPLYIKVLGALALSYQDAGREPDADRLATETIALVRQRTAGRGLEYFDALYMYGAVLGNLDRYSESAVALREVVTGYQRLYGGDNAQTIEAQNDLARALLAIGEFSDAAQIASRSLDSTERIQGRSSIGYAEANQLLGRIRFFQGDYADAAQRLGDSYRRKLAAQPVDDLDTLTAGYDLARPLIFLGRMREASALLAHEVPAALDSGYARYMRGMRLRWLGEVATANGDYATAHRQLDQAAVLLTSLKPADGTVVMKLRESQGWLLVREGRHAEAVTQLRSVIAAYRRLFPAGSALLRGAELRLAIALAALGKNGEANELRTAAQPVIERELLAGSQLRLELRELDRRLKGS